MNRRTFLKGLVCLPAAVFVAPLAATETMPVEIPPNQFVIKNKSSGTIILSDDWGRYEPIWQRSGTELVLTGKTSFRIVKA